MEKWRVKYDTATEAVERIKSDEAAAKRDDAGHKKMLSFMKRTKNEDDVALKASQNNDAYKAQLVETNNIRKKFYNIHLPHFLKVGHRGFPC